MTSKTLDDILRERPVAEAQSQTPSQNPNDSDSDSNFFDYVLNSVEYHDSKLRRKFKDLEFPAVVLRASTVENGKELTSRTCKTFAEQFIKNSGDAQKFWEIHAHVPEISGLLPQPTPKEMDEYKSGALTDPVSKERYEMITSRYPKFYCVSKTRPSIFAIHKVTFRDENFFYYGIMEPSPIHGSEELNVEAHTSRNSIPSNTSEFTDPSAIA